MIYQVFADELPKEARIQLPASKSLSNRALIIRALCPEPCRIDNLSDCDDTRVQLAAFEGNKPNIDIGAAGTSMRFLTAYLACTPGKEVVLTGSARMKERPIRLLVDALRELGADIEYQEKEGFPPLHIRGKQLEGGALSIDGSTSSQYISALLMIAPTLAKGLQLTLTGSITSRPYILMTLQLMRRFGVESSFVGNVITIAPQAYRALNYTVESDWSAASYWYEILLFGQPQLERVTLCGLEPESLQGDSRVAAFFAELGIDTRFTEEGAELTLSDRSLPEKVTWDLSDQPDLAQTLIASCVGAGIGFHMKGLHTLRIKETDRLKAMHDELQKFGVQVEVIGDDEMIYTPANSLPSAGMNPLDVQVFATYKDHRMAMALAPLSAAVRESVYVDDPGVVSKSYPDFWEHLKQVNFQVEPIDQSVDEFMAHAQEVKAQQERVHRHSKFILNTVLIACAAIVVLLSFKCCRW
ncbi:MAG: 3-phosphoshikimate 1-carboxyvinyltransferase [Bacteroidales bacterium]|nr:3-phosphoshikimate 1-carboxyvinyltransferase [Bacteroidales bacterium]